MTEVHIPLDSYTPGDQIEVDEYEDLVHLRIDLTTGNPHDHVADVSLTPGEARALAAVLIHCANESRRPEA